MKKLCRQRGTATPIFRNENFCYDCVQFTAADKPAFSTKRKKDELNAIAAKEQALTDAEEIRALKERIEELKTEAKIQKRIEQNRRKKTGLNTLKERLRNAV